MKKSRLLFVLCFILCCIFCIAHWVRYRHIARANYYQSIRYLQYSLYDMRDKNNILGLTIRKNIERLGMSPKENATFKEAEALNQKTQKMFDMLENVKSRDTIPHNFYDITVQPQGRQAIDFLQKYEQYIKAYYPYALSILDNLTDIKYLRTQSAAEADFVLNDLISRLLLCERNILDNLMIQFEPEKRIILPLVRSKKQTYYEGETFEGTLNFWNPVRFKKGEAKATVHGKSIDVDENGIARILLPVGKAGKYSFEGTFSCKYHKRDTVIKFYYAFDVLKK